MPLVFAGFNRMSAPANLASDALVTHGLANCIAVILEQGGKGVIAHFDTMNFYTHGQFDPDKVWGFRNWMLNNAFAGACFVVLGGLWNGHADLPRLRTALGQAFNAAIFNAMGGTAHYANGVIQTWVSGSAPPWITQPWDAGGRTAGTLINYERI